MNTKIYTPQVIAEKMASELLSSYYNNDTVMDNSCGNGSLIIELMRQIHADDEKDVDSFLRNLYINDNDKESVLEALDNINKEYVSLYGKESNIEVKHSFKNALTEDLFDRRLMDHIIINPPYGRLSDLDEDEVKKIKYYCNEYLFGKNDLYLLFLHVSMGQLYPNRKLLFVCPNRWVNSLNGTTLRERLVASSCDVTLWRSDKYKFDGVDTYPLVGCISKFARHANVKMFNEDKQIFIEKTSNMSEKPWELYSQIKIIDEDRFISVGKLGVSGGITTLTNKVFFLKNTKVEGDNLILEDGTEVELASTKVLYKSSKKIRVITPYKIDHTTDNLVPMEEMELKVVYPKAYEYLFKNKEKISTTIHGGKSTHRWWLWGRSQNLNNRFEKILVPTMVKEVKCVVVKDSDAFCADMLAIDTSCLTKSAINTLVLLLESNVFMNHIKNFNRTYKGGYYGVSSECLKSFKIPNLISGELNEFDTLQPCDQKRVLDKIYR